MRLVIAILAIFALVFFLKWQFPYALQSTDEQMNLLYSVGLLALIGSGFLHGRDFPAKEIFKSLFVWLVVLLVLVLGYSYRDLFMNNRLMAELVPHRAQLSDDGALTVRSANGGHFYIEIDINNVPVKFMVDTGASNIVLSPRDAERIGFDLKTLNYSRVFLTANGTVKGAPVRLNLLEVGSIKMRNVRASVNGAQMEKSLLGMDFLKSLTSYKVEGNTLTLVP